MGEWEDRLERAVIGEVQGEAYFETMAGLVEDGEQRDLLLRCAELERRVHARIAPVATAAGLRIDATDVERQQWIDYAVEDAAAGWAHIVKGMDEGTVDAITRYESMRPIAPESCITIVDLLVLHETALHDVGVHERAGDRHAARETIERAIAAVG